MQLLIDHFRKHKLLKENQNFMGKAMPTIGVNRMALFAALGREYIKDNTTAVPAVQLARLHHLLQARCGRSHDARRVPPGRARVEGKRHNFANTLGAANL